MSNTNTPDFPNGEAKVALFRRLRALKAVCVGDRVNRRDQVIILIQACIDEGIKMGGSIVGALVAIGYKRKYVGRLLVEGKKHFWCKSIDGTYINLQ